MDKDGAPLKTPQTLRKKERKTYPAPFSLRLSDEERALLDRLANGLPWATHIKDVLFQDIRKPKRGITLQDRQTLAKLLAMLGKSRISQNINQLAKAANSGSLPVTPDVVKALMEAAHAVTQMRTMLIEGMGLKAHDPGDEGDTS